MFTLTQCGPTRGDCTAPYTVNLDKEYTVEELVDAIITNNPGEWGSIKLESFFGETICSYKWGKITDPIIEQYKHQKIVDIKADGGWSVMDYIIKVEPALEKKPNSIHFVEEGSPAGQVMTVGWLKALLDSYPEDSIVFISDDAITARQITGFFTASDLEYGKPYLILTTRKDAPSETYQGPGKECKVNAEG